MPWNDRLTQRRLDDVAVISLPSSIKEEILRGNRTLQDDRLSFTFASSYFWASMGSVTRYKQLLVVSLMAPDAPAAAYDEWPRAYTVSLERAREVHASRAGAATVTVRAGTYEKGADPVPAHRFEYVDPSHRLHIVWHAVRDEMSLQRGLELLPKIAASFRLTGDPAAQFAEMRDRPRREGAERARRLALARQTLAQGGFPELEPGAPVLRDGMYVEWMSDPEPRFQLLVPLGRVKAVTSEGGIPPMPIAPRLTSSGPSARVGTVGWLAWRDDAWELSNRENDYLPFPGIAERLRAGHTSRGEVSYYYSATVRVEEVEDDALLSTLRWFTDGIAEVERQWRAGALVRGAAPIVPGG